MAGSPSEPLGEGTRRFLEDYFGRRLDDLRVHRDRIAAQGAQDLRAEAFAIGPHIYLGPNPPLRGSIAERALLAHEAAHAIQAREGRLHGPRGKTLGSSDPLEAQARAAERGAAGGWPATLPLGSVHIGRVDLSIEADGGPVDPHVEARVARMARKAIERAKAELATRFPGPEVARLTRLEVLTDRDLEHGPEEQAIERLARAIIGRATQEAGRLAASAAAFGATSVIARKEAPAERVVQGHSAADLLAPSGGSAAGRDGAPVQHLLGGLKRFAKATKDFVTNPKKAIHDVRLGMEGRQERVLGDAHEISNQDIILEQLAHGGAYGNLDQSKLPYWGFLEAGRVDDPESGFHCVLYMPTPDALAGATQDAKVIQAMHGGPPPPVLAFAGTDPKNKRDVSDDTHRAGVGAYQFVSNIAKIKAVMGAAGGKKVIVTGHSLGGALAQHAACNFPGYVARVVTFQAPGIGEADVAKLRAYNERAAPEVRIRSTHHRAEGDLVHAAGKAITDGDVYEFQSVGIGNPGDHMQYPLARLAMARGGLIPGVGGGGKAEDKLVRVEKRKADQVKGDVANKVAEWGRTHLGAIARQSDMEPYVAVWKDIQKMCETGEYTLKYILGVIQASDKLTDVQKVKMRDSVKGMYADVLS